jgi:hypothetical protein
MRCALVLIASQAVLGLLSRKPPPAKPVTIHAHLAAADSLSAGLDASTQLANSEHLRLEGVIANLHAELKAAELEHARNAKKAAPTMPPLPAVLPTPLLPRTEVLAKKMLQDTLRMLLDHKINSTTQLVMEVAQKAGEHVASAAADAAAQHASEVAAKQLVTFACDFAAGPWRPRTRSSFASSCRSRSACRTPRAPRRCAPSRTTTPRTRPIRPARTR